MCDAPTRIEPVEFVSLPEISRRIGISASTLRRRLARENIAPDGVLIEGPLLRTPIILTAKVPHLRTIIEKANK
jgi:transposase-like protein